MDDSFEWNYFGFLGWRGRREGVGVRNVAETTNTETSHDVAESWSAPLFPLSMRYDLRPIREKKKLTKIIHTRHLVLPNTYLGEHTNKEELEPHTYRSQKRRKKK